MCVCVRGCFSSLFFLVRVFDPVSHFNFSRPLWPKQKVLTAFCCCVRHFLVSCSASLLLLNFSASLCGFISFQCLHLCRSLHVHVFALCSLHSCSLFLLFDVELSTLFIVLLGCQHYVLFYFVHILHILHETKALVPFAVLLCHAAIVFSQKKIAVLPLKQKPFRVRCCERILC